MPTFVSVIVSLFYSAAITVLLGYRFASLSSGPDMGLGGLFFALFICGPILFVLIFLALFFIKKRLDPKKFLKLLFALTILFPIFLFLYQFFVRGGILDHLLVS